MKTPRNRRTVKPKQPAQPSGPPALPPIECVVVLMLENRSFDHLFGKWPGAAGIAQGSFSNRPNPLAPASPAGNAPIPAGQPALYATAQGQGPGHSLDA